MKEKDKTAQAHPGKRSLVRNPLDTLAGIIGEATRVYRAARDKRMDHTEARSLVWMLAQMRAMVETAAVERLEARLEEIAAAANSIGSNYRGYTPTARPPQLTH